MIGNAAGKFFAENKEKKLNYFTILFVINVRYKYYRCENNKITKMHYIKKKKR